jgi:hypothetical protein
VRSKAIWGAVGVLLLVVALGAGLLVWRILRAAPPAVEQPPVKSAERRPLKLSEVVYDGSFGKGWEDWGWGPRGPKEGGVLRVGFSGFGGIVFRHAELPSRFGAVVFRFRAPKGFGQFLAVSLKSRGPQAQAMPSVSVEDRHVEQLDGGWTQAVIPWRALNPSSAPFDRIVIEARELVGSEWVEIDKVALAEPTADEPPTWPTKPGKLTVDCRGKALRVSPLIYGLASDSKGAGETALRFGGNRMTRFNWELHSLNTGSDWFFENVAESSGPFSWLQSTAKSGKKTSIVVPTIGWVAKDGTSVGFPSARFGRQRAHDPKRDEAGDGHKPDGTPIDPGPPAQTSVAAPPQLIRSWIERVKKQDAAAGSRSVDIYILDNEPDLWHVTHRDVHPEPVTYDELLDRSIRYGTAIREADPDALIAGPASWGWPGYFYSAKDATAPRWQAYPDRKSHGDKPLLAWYLERLAEHERRTGVRVLDVLDVHYYPQAPGICQQARTDAEGSALRLRSTRSLWDPSYEDESWVDDRVRLLPRLQEWVDGNYPGRKLQLGEWSFCAEEHISGGLAIAEALGRFAQNGLFAAFFWGNVSPGTPAFWAYRAYRDFDGHGSSFLDWSLSTQGGENTSFFASRDESGSRLVAIAINLDPANAVDAELDVSSCGAVKSQRVFSYAAGDTEIRPRGEDAGSSAQTRLAPYSMTIFDLAIDKAAQP